MIWEEADPETIEVFVASLPPPAGRAGTKALMEAQALRGMGIQVPLIELAKRLSALSEQKEGPRPGRPRLHRKEIGAEDMQVLERLRSFGRPVSRSELIAKHGRELQVNWQYAFKRLLEAELIIQLGKNKGARYAPREAAAS